MTYALVVVALILAVGAGYRVGTRSLLGRKAPLPLQTYDLMGHGLVEVIAVERGQVLYRSLRGIQRGQVPVSVFVANATLEMEGGPDRVPSSAQIGCDPPAASTLTLSGSEYRVESVRNSVVTLSKVWYHKNGPDKLVLPWNNWVTAAASLTLPTELKP